jgi:glycosyltransferase involved in cell wall biosynthesis
VFEVPLCNRIIDRSLGLIVHSKTTAATIQTIRPDRPARVIPALIAPLEGNSLRKSLGYPEDTVIFASLGFVNVTKQIELALSTFARLRQAYPNIAYLIVGEIQGDIDLTRLVAELGLENCVKLTGYVQDLSSFLDWTATADVVINLRNPTLGETSAAALRAMAAGKPIIVFDHGWYGELSEEVCRKVPPMDSEALLAAMHDLARDSELRRRMGENAQLAVRQDHNPRKVAEAYIDFTKSVLAENNRRLIRW